MAKDMYDFTKLAPPNMDAAMKMWGDWTKSWQAVTAEMTDYAKRSFEEGTQTMEKLVAARSLEQVVEIQSSYARRCYEDYMAQMSKMGAMYADIAKDSAKPLEKLMPARR